MDLLQRFTMSSVMVAQGNSKVRKLCISLLGEHVVYTYWLLQLLGSSSACFHQFSTSMVSK